MAGTSREPTGLASLGRMTGHRSLTEMDLPTGNAPIRKAARAHNEGEMCDLTKSPESRVRNSSRLHFKKFIVQLSR